MKCCHILMFHQTSALVNEHICACQLERNICFNSILVLYRVHFKQPWVISDSMICFFWNSFCCLLMCIFADSFMPVSFYQYYTAWWYWWNVYSIHHVEQVYALACVHISCFDLTLNYCFLCVFVSLFYNFFINLLHMYRDQYIHTLYIIYMYIHLMFSEYGCIICTHV